MELEDSLDLESVKALTKAWASFLAGRGLYHVGAVSGERLTYLVASEASQAMENDRVAALAWLASRPELHGWQVGDLEDIERDG